MKDIYDHLAGLPESIKPIITTVKPNDTIFLVKDDQFKIKTKQREILVTGFVGLKWFPQISVYFEGTTDKFYGLNFEKDFDILTKDDELLGKGFLINEGQNQSNYFLKGVFSLGCSKGDSTIPVNEVRFVVPNMRIFSGQRIKDELKSYSGRIFLKTEDLELTLDRLPDAVDRIKKLKDSGGYHITYSGMMSFKKPKNRLELVHDIGVLNCFLQLLSGDQVAGMFYTGMHENEIVWQDFRIYGVESYNERGQSCFPSYLRDEDLSALEVAYNNIQQYWKKDDQREMIKLAISWYLEAKNKPWFHHNTSMIIAQSALEMFFNWFMVERENIIRGRTTLSAANKIRLLLSKIGIEFQIPKKYSELYKFVNDPKNKSEEDVIDALVLYRNSIVHGEYDKRLKLLSFSPRFKEEAKHLTVWYLELCILFMLEYNGFYCNRTTVVYTSDSEMVPWRKKENKLVD